MKKFKAIISTFLVCALFWGLMTISFSSNASKIVILKNDDVQCVVKETTNQGVTIATNNKVTNKLIVQKFDSLEKTLLSTEIINLETIAHDMGTSEVLDNRIHWGNGDAYQHTFSDREYDVWYGSPNEWKIKKKDSERWLDETTSNANELESFRADVEDVNEAEFIIIGAIGGTAAATAVAAFLSGGTAAGIAAAGGGTVIVTAFANLNKACNNADYHYDRI